MVSTKSQKKASKKFYDSNKNYRKKKIQKETEKHKSDKPKYAKEQREYYSENEKYRKYKKTYAKEYRDKEPIKSKARKYRKAK